MKKLMISAAVAAMLGAGASAAVAAPKDGQNTHGMCTAYHSGNKNGWDKNGMPGPFVALVERAGDYDEDGDRDADDVRSFCTENDPKFRK